MSYDLAVWQGARPADDRAAGAAFERLYDLYVAVDDPAAPVSPIAAFVTVLLDRYPEIDTEAGDDSPWSTGPLIGQARGPLLYLSIVWSQGEEVSAWIAGLAEQHQLHCYDPQRQQLRTPAATAWRFELTSERGHAVRDPNTDTVRRVLARLSNDNFFAILTRADDWYIQVGYGQRAGTRPGWYALERREGGPGRHFRADVTNLDDVIRAFTCFLADDPSLGVRFAWRPYAV